MEPSSSTVIVIPLLALGVVAATLAVLIFTLLRRRGTMRQWADRVAGTERLEFGRLFSARAGNEDYHHLYYRAANKRPPAFRLFLPVQTDLAFLIRREGAVERFFKRIGINRETQVGDRAFDHRYYIVTDQEEETRRLLFDAKARRAVDRLFELGFTTLGVGEGRIEGIIQPYAAKAPLSRATLEAAVEVLVALRKGLPKGSMRDCVPTCSSRHRLRRA